MLSIKIRKLIIKLSWLQRWLLFAMLTILTINITLQIFVVFYWILYLVNFIAVRFIRALSLPNFLTWFYNAIRTLYRTIN